MATRELTADDSALLAAFAGGASARSVAAKLGFSKSALSRRIAALEEAIGADVFLRRGRSLVVTALGELLIARASAAESARRDLQAAASDAGNMGPRLTVALSPLFAELLVPSVLSELLARHPDARFEVRLGHDYAELFDDRIDVAIRRGPLPDSTSLNAKRLGSLAMICVASPKLAERFAGDLDSDSIASLPWIRVGSKLEPFSLVVGRGKRPFEARIHPRISVDSQRVALSLAEASAGVARVNAFLARSALADGRLIEIIPEARSLESAFAVYPRRARPGRLLTELLAALAAACKRHDIWDRE